MDGCMQPFVSSRALHWHEGVSVLQAHLHPCVSHVLPHLMLAWHCPPFAMAGAAKEFAAAATADPTDAAAAGNQVGSP